MNPFDIAIVCLSTGTALGRNFMAFITGLNLKYHMRLTSSPIDETFTIVLVIIDVLLAKSK